MHAGKYRVHRVAFVRASDPISPYYPLAHMGLARAYALQGDKALSRREYEEFFALWKDADQDIPILREARSAYAGLEQRSQAKR